jgi:DNA-directed RNA polymerase specialized sigma24 family protein
MPEAKHLTSPTQYASSGDFCRVFYEETDSLYRLSFLLTADSEKAQQCFVTGLENSVNGNPVFKDWARSWARRAIIQNAVRIINPWPTEENAPSESATDGRTLAKGQPEIAAVLDLAPFERFVFVMSVLEHYSEHECSILLDCSRREVVAARIRALRKIGRVMGSDETNCLNAAPGVAQAQSNELVVLVQISQNMGGGWQQ